MLYLKKALLLLAFLLLTRTSLLASGSPPQTVEFIQNQGQWDAKAQFSAALTSGRLFLESSGFTYALFDPRTMPVDSARGHTSQASLLRCHAYSMTFAGSQPTTPVAEMPLSVRYNYFLGADPTRWAHDVPAFRRVRYPNLYPGIEAVVYENQQSNLEYDFLVQPGASPEAIQLRYEGATRLRLHNQQLLIETSVGTVTELAPRAWQTGADGRRHPVPCAYELAGNVVRFQLGSYDPRLALTIDPTVVFATYSGSTADNWGVTATYDAQGNLYSASLAFGQGYPVSMGAYDQTYSNGIDVGIIKYNTQVSGQAARIYATYLGGRSADSPHRLVVDGNNELVVFGTTSSTDFPTTAGCFDPTFNGGQAISPGDAYLKYANGSDLFVARLSAGGNALRAATFLGGAGNEGITSGAGLYTGDIAVDGDNNVVLASHTNSSNFAMTAGSYATTFRGGPSDAVVCKLSADLRTLQWSTFLGGNDADAAYALQLDAARNVYVCGSTSSPDFPVTAGAYQPPGTGNTDGFVARLSASGQALQNSCRLGFTGPDRAQFIQLDRASNVFVLGYTSHLTPISPGRFTTPGGTTFLQKLSPDLRQSFFLTRFGNPVDPASTVLGVSALGLDDCERIYVGSGIIVFRLSQEAVALETTISSFYGGNHRHGDSRFDGNGILYQSVCGGCTGRQFPMPSGARYYSQTNQSGGDCNDVALKIELTGEATGALPEITLCRDSEPRVLGGSPAGGTWSGPGVTLTGGLYYFTPSLGIIGLNALTYSPPPGASCSNPTRSLPIKVLPPTMPVITVADAAALCENQPNSVLLSALPAGGVFSGPGVSGNLFWPRQAGPGQHTITYSFLNSTQCGTGTRTVTVLPAPIVQAGPDTVLCGMPAAPFQLRGASPTGGTWSGRGVSSAGVFDPAAVLRLVSGPSDNFLYYTYTAANGCTAQDIRKVTLVPQAGNVFKDLDLPRCVFNPDFRGVAPFTITFPPTAYGIGTYTWNFGDGTDTTYSASSYVLQVRHTYRQPGTYTPTLTARYGLTCASQVEYGSFTIAAPQPLPNIITPNGDGRNDTFVQQLSCEPPTLKVFSKWGRLVYETAAYRNDWTAAGLAEGIYYFHLFTPDGSAKGWLEVVR
ncbi:gliding motility-associated C-terminal domain-containing protein [Hymenobacter sp. BT175]|uniref:DUF7948 domain-containing protein n=1 Tax=Hymenobacter translucens TaxID=2886507 RepID=UPI001D0E7E6C|nr:gliding motility-associated C-terminal domain-containing protein [Hymenobacter translucens]MCC2547175.1 gliding motility-associated C-terminal domain-containing protein [Hymenobacter translucens]